MAVKSFVRGSSVYTCRCCGRSTRASQDRAEGDTQLCYQCYELAGYENMLSDDGELSQTSIEVMIDLFEELEDKKGVDRSRIEHAFKTLWDYAWSERDGDEPDSLVITPAGVMRESEYDAKRGATLAAKRARQKARRAKAK